MNPWVLLARPKALKTWADVAQAYAALFGPGPTHGRFWADFDGNVHWQDK